MPESPAIGMILARLLTDVVEDPTLNTRTTLLTRARILIDELALHGQGGSGGPSVR
jgi:hypothetical protein